MTDVYIVSACRTPIGSFGGQFNDVSGVTLGTTCIQHCLERAKLKPENISEVILGQVLVAGQGQNPARQTALAANIPVTTPAYTINLLCGSGLKAVCLGYQAIINKDSDVVLCGGQESMSRAQHSAFIRGGTKLGAVQFTDTLLTDGLTDAFCHLHMGQTAEFLAREYKVSRKDQDDYAFQSQKKASEAIANRWFEAEVVPVVLPKKKGITTTTDEFVKTNITREYFDGLRTCFETDIKLSPSVTPGNSSGINDGAAAVILANKLQVDKLNLQPLAKIVGFAQTALEPKRMGLGPVSAVKTLLTKINWLLAEVDLFELNEAFAVQSILVQQQLDVDKAKVNVTGGAIALGHPIGCSGARVLVTLIYNLKRLNKKKGIAALCVGGGMGIALAIEMC